MSSQIKITRALRSEPQSLMGQEYSYLQPIQPQVIPTEAPAKKGLFSPFLMSVNGFFFGACLLTVMFLQGQLKEQNLAFVSWTIVLASILFAIAFIIGAISSLGRPEFEGEANQNSPQKVWSLGFTLVGMLFLLFSMFVVMLG